MYGILGDFNGKIHVDRNASPEFVYARVNVYHEIGGPPKLEVIIVKNKGTVANVYGLPVNIWDGEVTSVWNYGVPFRSAAESG